MRGRVMGPWEGVVTVDGGAVLDIVVVWVEGEGGGG